MGTDSFPSLSLLPFPFATDIELQHIHPSLGQELEIRQSLGSFPLPTSTQHVLSAESLDQPWCWNLSWWWPLAKPSFPNWAAHSAHTAESAAAPCLVWFPIPGLNLPKTKRTQITISWGIAWTLLKLNSAVPVSLEKAQQRSSGSTHFSGDSENQADWATALRMSGVKSKLFTWKVVESIIVLFKTRKQSPGLGLLQLQALLLLIPGTWEQVLVQAPFGSYGMEGRPVQPQLMRRSIFSSVSYMGQGLHNLQGRGWEMREQTIVKVLSPVFSARGSRGYFYALVHSSSVPAQALLYIHALSGAHQGETFFIKFPP